MSRRKTVTFELATSSERKRSVRDFRRQCYSLMGRTDLLQDESVAGSVQQRLDDQLNLIEARLGDETVGTIRWGTYVSVRVALRSPQNTSVHGLNGFLFLSRAPSGIR